jgi:hypothetical protein
MLERLRRPAACALVYLLAALGCGAGPRPSQPVPAAAASVPQAATPPKAEPGRAAKDWGTGVIEPGRGVGPLKLGDTHARALELFGPTEEDYNFEGASGPCDHSEMHWYDAGTDSNGLFVYLRGGRVYEIASATPRYVTAEGLKNGSTPADVRRRYPSARAYALLESGGKEVGGRDIVYWVARESGVAFELYYNPEGRARYVESVVVFEPGTEFQPKGCRHTAPAWIELKPFALEPPARGRHN